MAGRAVAKEVEALFLSLTASAAPQNQVLPATFLSRLVAGDFVQVIDMIEIIDLRGEGGREFSAFFAPPARCPLTGATAEALSPPGLHQ